MIAVDKCAMGYEFECSGGEPLVSFQNGKNRHSYFEIKPKILSSERPQRPGDSKPRLGKETIDYSTVMVSAFAEEPKLGLGPKPTACKYELSFGKQDNLKAVSGNESSCLSDRNPADVIMPKIQLRSLIRFCRGALSFNSQAQKSQDLFKCSNTDSSGAGAGGDSGAKDQPAKPANR